MSSIDLIKRYRQTLAEKFLPAPVVYHHVPKCGGTSLGRALRKRYFISQAGINHPAVLKMAMARYPDISPEARWENVSRFKEETLLYHLFNNTRCVVAHVGFSRTAYQEFSDRYSFITLLRDPVERFMSNYFYRYHKQLDVDFDAFLETDAARYMGARYLQYFYAGNDWSEMFSQSSIDQAKANLECMSVVGFLDNLAGFSRQIGETLGMRLNMGHENKGSTNSTIRDSITTEQMERIRELCAPDIEIYAYAQQSFGLVSRRQE